VIDGHGTCDTPSFGLPFLFFLNVIPAVRVPFSGKLPNTAIEAISVTFLVVEAAMILYLIFPAMRW
jgi:hypothetical protein